jgi:CBS domain-containing protein
MVDAIKRVRHRKATPSFASQANLSSAKALKWGNNKKPLCVQGIDEGQGAGWPDASRSEARTSSNRSLPMRKLSDMVFHQRPVTMRPSETVQIACERMRDARVGSILITDEHGILVGIFTGRDAVCRVVAAGRMPESTRLSEVMTPKPTTLTPNKNALDALRTMWDGGFRHIPVVEHGRLLGVISRGDFRADESTRLEDERDFWEHMR